jgi:DNA-binding CsgD family transcriptional regulator
MILDFILGRDKRIIPEIMLQTTCCLSLVGLSLMLFFSEKFALPGKINPTELYSILNGNMASLSIQYFISSWYQRDKLKFLFPVFIFMAMLLSLAEIATFILNTRPLFQIAIYASLGLLTLSLLIAGLHITFFKLSDRNQLQAVILKMIGITLLLFLPVLVVVDFTGSQDLVVFPVFFTVIQILLISLHVNNQGMATARPRDLYQKLTKREKEILPMLAEGKTYSEIATELFLSQATIKSHINNIYKKLGIRSRIELIRKYPAEIHHPESPESF